MLVFDRHKLSVVWNNCFREIFNCCWRESVSSLLYFCNVMPMSYLFDERRLIFLSKMLNSDKQLLSILAKGARNEFIATADKYNVTLFMSKSNIQSHIWQTFKFNWSTVHLELEYCFFSPFIRILVCFYCIDSCMCCLIGVLKNNNNSGFNIFSCF